VFINEKGLKLETVEINLRTGEQFGAAFLKVNPLATVPCLELDDGNVILETMAICRYIEALHPTPNLFGAKPLDIARIEQWSRRAEMEGFLPAADALRNGEPRFANRAVPGVRDYAQIPELAERGKTRCQGFFADLDRQLAGREFVATDFFSAADINAYVTVEFAARVGVKPDSTMSNLLRWYKAVGERPSVRALPAPP
jgi:glutathione S-transferase